MSTENNVFNQDIWSSGSQKSKADATRKIIMTSTTNYGAMLFPKKTHEQKPEFTAEASPDAGSIEKSEDGKKAENAYPGDIKTEDEKKDKYARANAALIKNGYDPKNYKDETLNHIEKALSERGGVISEFTGRAWLAKEGELQEPPASIRPESLKIGDRVQLLHWRNLGVHGANINLFPEPASGKVSKVYRTKVKISKDKMPYTVVPVKGAAFDDEDRVIGLELDGKGNSSGFIKDEKGDDTKNPTPYGVRESSVVLKYDDGGTKVFRQPPLGAPEGNTSHVQPIMQ